MDVASGGRLLAPWEMGPDTCDMGDAESFKETGALLVAPTFRQIMASTLPGFKPGAGVGDRGNPNGLSMGATMGVWRDHKRAVVVRPGLLCDMASVPGLAYVAALDATPVDLWDAGYVHDYVYRWDALIWNPADLIMFSDNRGAYTFAEIRTGARPFPHDRSDCDKVYAKICKLAGCDRDDVWKMGAGLWAGGWKSYHRKTIDWRYPEPEQDLDEVLGDYYTAVHTA